MTTPVPRTRLLAAALTCVEHMGTGIKAVNPRGAWWLYAHGETAPPVSGGWSAQTLSAWLVATNPVLTQLNAVLSDEMQSQLQLIPSWEGGCLQLIRS